MATLNEIIEQGADFAGQGSDGRHPAFDPEGGFDVNRVDADGLTLGHYAAAAGNWSACRLLTEAGANWNAQDDRGRTPGHLAAEAGHPRLCVYLSDAGGLNSKQNADGKSVLELLLWDNLKGYGTDKQDT